MRVVASPRRSFRGRIVAPQPGLFTAPTIAPGAMMVRATSRRLSSGKALIIANAESAGAATLQGVRCPVAQPASALSTPQRRNMRGRAFTPAFSSQSSATLAIAACQRPVGRPARRDARGKAVVPSGFIGASGSAMWSHVQGGASARATGSQTTLSMAPAAPITIGNLAVVSVAAYYSGTPTLSDSLGNTWIKAGSEGSALSLWYSLITTGGSTVITLTFPSGNLPQMCYDEYAVAPGNSFALNNVVGASQNSANTLNAGGVALSGDDLVYGAFTTSNSQVVWTAPTNFNVRLSRAGNSGQYQALLAADMLNETGTSLAVTATASVSGQMAGLAASFKAAVPAILPSPFVIPSGHSGNITIALAGSGVNWLTGTTVFAASGVSGFSVVSQQITSPTSATVKVAPGTATGTLTVSDGTNTASVYVKAPSMGLSPPGIGIGQATAITIAGYNTVWLAENPSTLFSLSGVAGAVITSVSVNSNTSATIVVAHAAATGTLTVTDNSTSRTASLVCYSQPPSFSFSAVAVPAVNANFTLTLTGINTLWTPAATQFAISGVAGVSIVSQTVSSASSATLTLAIGYSTGTLTVSDGNYTATIPVTGGATISNAYVSRNGQTAYFLATAFAIQGTPGTPCVVGTTVTSGGTGYSAPTAVVSGGVALTLSSGGSGYTSAPTVTLSGGGGTGASATAIISSGIALTLVSGGSNYSSSPVVTIVGGSGSGASATAVVSGGVITGFNLTPGAGYLNGVPPTVTITDSTGSGAAATAWIPSGAVSGFNVVPGSGYTSAPSVTIAGGGGLYASASAAVTSSGGTGCVLGTPVVSNGVITQIPVVAAGSGYTSPPAITITDPTGSGASAVCVLGGSPAEISSVNSNPTIAVNGAPVQTAVYVTQIAVANPGSGYPAPPTVTISGGGGSGATATAAYSVNGTLALTLGSGGGGYATVPTVTIGSGLGTGATATASKSSGSSSIATLYMPNAGSGYLPVTVEGGSGAGVQAAPLVTTAGQVSVQLVSGGSGYFLPPTVSFTGGGGSGAAATAVISGGAVVGFIVTSPGAGYSSAPTVSLTGGGGTGAVATAGYGAGAVYAVNLVSGGSGYLASDKPTVVVGPPASGTTAVLVPVLGPIWTSSSKDWPFVPYQMICGGVQSIVVQSGGSNYTNPTVVISGGGGSGTVLGTPVVVNGVITAITIASPGTSANQAADVSVTDSTGAGSGFVGYTNASASGFTNVRIESGGRNYTAGKLTVGIVDNFSNSGYTFNAPTLANGVLESIPVLSPGSGYTSLPTITITDPTGSGAVAVAVMSGPAATDTVTYSAAFGWLTASVPYTIAGKGYNALAPVPAATNALMTNSAGSIEPWFGQVPRTMNLGVGFGTPNGPGCGYQKQQNWLKFINFGTSRGFTPPTVTITPASGDTTGGLATAVANVNTAGAVSSFTITCGGAHYTAAPIVSITAPPSGSTATATATISGGVVTGITVVNGGAGYAGVDAYGHPNALNGVNYPDNTSSNGVPTGFVTVDDSNFELYFSPGSYGDVSGVWTFIADEANPSNPMTVQLYGSNASGNMAKISPMSGYPTGTGVGKTWCWNVPRLNGADINVTLAVSGPTKSTSAPWTLSNEFMASPLRGSGLAQTINRAQPYAPNPNLISWISSQNGVYPEFIRCSPFGDFINGGNNVVDASDLQSATSFSYVGKAPAVAVGIAVRQYQISSVGSPGWQSPYIWTGQNYPGTAAVAGGPFPYAWSPPNNATGNNVNFFANKTPSTGVQNFAAEIVTASPHGFKTGQVIEWSGGPSSVPIYDAYAGTNVYGNLSGFEGPVYITSATTFAVVFPGVVNPNNTVICNVSGSTAATWTITAPIVNGGNSLPFECLASIVSAVPNAGMHVLLPCMMTDACVTQIATTIRDILPVGRRVLPEYTDEHWNWVYPWANNHYVFASLSAGAVPGIQSYSGDSFFALRQSQVHQIFIDVFNERDINGNVNRGGSIVRAFGSGLSQSGTTQAMIQFANTYNASNPANPVLMDCIMVAPYLDIDTDVILASAAASVYSHLPGSIQYQSVTPWTLGAWVDLWRHHARYNLLQSDKVATQVAILPEFTLPAGQTAAPRLIAYEGGPEYVIPAAVSLTDWMLRIALAHDLSYHPYYYDVMVGFWQAMQSQGFSLHQANELCYLRGGPASASLVINGQSDGYGAALWEYVTWEGQSWGKGDGSVDGNGNDTVNLFFRDTGLAQDWKNVSPKLSAWRDWSAAANVIQYQPGTASSNPAPMRWFPRLRRRP